MTFFNLWLSSPRPRQTATTTDLGCQTFGAVVFVWI